MTAEAVTSEIIRLLQDSGGEQYFGEAVTKLAHAEQCAWWARQSGADEEMILAALLHDIGHLLDGEEGAVRDAHAGVVNHDTIGERWLLARGFSARLASLVGGHVDAKRYLTAANASYLDRLSPASLTTLRLQGGPMGEAGAAVFAEDAGLNEKLRLRSWDELAKDPGWRGPGVEEYRTMIVRHLEAYRLAE